MKQNEINVDEVLKDVTAAIEQGNYRKATKKESMAVRLAALGEIVKEMQALVKNDKELVEAK